jgi:Centromere DNA-binding protein complex CBF3 subunit, domain 2
VDEGKLLLFIKEEVASRPPRKGRRLKAERKRKSKSEHATRKKRKGESGAILEEGDDDEACSELVLMYNTVRGYCSAINELWAHQTSQGYHSAERPQRVAMKALKTSIARSQHQQRRDEFEDRGLATARDGYTAAEIPTLTRKVWGQSLGTKCTEQQFRTQLCFLFGNSMLLRLSNRLPMELPDLFSMSLPNEGLNQTGWCLVTVMDQGKTNQHGRLEYGAALRHRDYRSCLVGALATYFFWRWHCSGEQFPCFRTSQDWYNIKVLKRDNTDPTAPLSDSTAASWTRRLYSEAGFTTSKVTHAGRVSGARLAELNGVSEDQIRRGGRWNADQMTGCYLTTLPREFMRGVADFDPE